MRVFCKLYYSLLIIIFLGTSAFAQAIYESYSGFTVPVTPVLPSAESHPSLWFKQSDITALIIKKDADAYTQKVWTAIQSDIKKYSTKTASQQNINERPRMAKILAFGWIVNADTALRRKAIEALMLAYDNVPRTETTADFSNDYDEIYRATWLQNYCEAYDWLYTSLTTEQNTIIRNKLIQETRILRNNMIAGAKYATRPHNHKSKPAYGIITAALTLTSEAAASDWLQFGLTMANTVTKYQFSSDGIYREGSHYFMYSVVNFLPYLWQYKNVSGVDHFQYYKPCFEMPLLLRNSKGWIPNIEDSYVKPVPTHMAAKAYVNTPTMLNSKEPLAKILQWNWFSTNFFTTDYTGATNDVVWNIDEFITYDPAIKAVAPDINPNVKTSCGAVVFRDNDSYDKAPSKYLYFNGVAECDNHQHPDLLSYTIESNGTITAVDAGYGKDGYSDSKRSWYIAPYAHNTVTVNNNSPLDLAVNIPPKELQYINSPSLVFAEKEAKISAADGLIKRGIAFPNKKYWVVYDLVSASVKTDYMLTVHSRGLLYRDVNKFTWTTLNDTYGTSQKLHSYILTSGNNTMTPKTGYTSLFKDEVSQTYVETVQNSDTALFMHLLYPDVSTSVFPSVADESIPGVTAFSLTDTNKDIFALQKRNSKYSMSDYSTDAIFVWLNAGSNLNKYFMNRGKVFSYKGTEILICDNISSLEVDYSNQQKEIIYVDTLLEKTQIKIKPRTGSDTINEVLYNGTPIQFGKVNGFIVVNIDGYGVLELLSTTSIKEGRGDGIETFGIRGNYPNPFNPATRISISTYSGRPVNLSVYDLLGRCKRKLINNESMKGSFEVLWDGKDESGIQLPSGVYIFAFTDGMSTNIKKGLLVK